MEAKRKAYREKFLEELQESARLNQGNVIKNKIPEYPPCFEELEKSLKLEISDYTDGFRRAPFGKDAEYSAVWSNEIEYPEKWDDMSDKEKTKFNSERKTILNILKMGVEKNGGALKVKDFNEKSGTTMFEGSGMIEAAWKISHEKNSLLTIWSVKLVSAYRLFDRTPYISIYIAHSKI